MQVHKRPDILRLSAKDAFEELTASQKLYAHHLARAAWYGTRIILQQVSPEALPIFEFILELHKACDGQWANLSRTTGLPPSAVNEFLLYSATFLQNIGNYYGHGDQKFILSMEQDVLRRLSAVSPTASNLHSEICARISAPQPSLLGYASATTQSRYYLGEPMSVEEIDSITRVMAQNSLYPEHTRLQKSLTGQSSSYEILCGSIEHRPPIVLPVKGLGDVHLTFGDYSEHLKKICTELSLALKYAENTIQQQYLEKVIESFTHGDMRVYKDSQKLWVQDQMPRIESVYGFVEPYRDPHGVRAEFEGLVGIVHPGETEMLIKLVQNADQFIPSLPWVVSTTDTVGNGPFESTAVSHRDFSSLHTLAYCSSLIFPGINLPNFNDIRQKYGFKNIMMMNRIDGAPMSGDSKASFLAEQEAQTYLSHRKQAYYLWVVFHELFGHGTGRFLEETEPGVFNFEPDSPPISPITNKPITSWYRYGQTWTGVFGDIATRVDECRAECIGAILLSHTKLMSLCGVTHDTEPSLHDIEYNAYLQLAVAGLRSLENYTVSEKRWGQAHSQGHFAMFRALHEQGDGILSVDHDQKRGTLSVAIDRSKILTTGKSALERLALRLHIYRCTADVENCRTYFDEMTRVHPIHVVWRDIVVSNKPPSPIFVQPNTFIVNDTVELRDYEPSLEGVVQSWVERCV